MKSLFEITVAQNLKHPLLLSYSHPLKGIFLNRILYMKMKISAASER